MEFRQVVERSETPVSWSKGNQSAVGTTEFISAAPRDNFPHNTDG